MPQSQPLAETLYFGLGKASIHQTGPLGFLDTKETTILHMQTSILCSAFSYRRSITAVSVSIFGQSKCFVPRSAGFAFVPTFFSERSRSLIRCCSHRYERWMCFALPNPRRVSIAFAALASKSKTPDLLQTKIFCHTAGSNQSCPCTNSSIKL